MKNILCPALLLLKCFPPEMSSASIACLKASSEYVMVLSQQRWCSFSFKKQHLPTTPYSPNLPLRFFCFSSISFSSLKEFPQIPNTLLC